MSITTDTSADSVEFAYMTGDLVPVTFYVAGNGPAGVFGVEFEIAALVDDVVIHNIAFEPAFSEVMGGAETEFPTSHFKTVRTQPWENLNRSLGADGVAVPFATVYLQILTDRSVASAIEVKARGALIGRAPEKTTVFDPETTKHTGQVGSNTLDIINLSEAAMGGGALDGGGAFGDTGALDGEVGELSSSVTPHGQFAEVTLELRELDGTLVGSHLIAGREYEVYYQTDGPNVNDYGLHIMTGPGGQGVSIATQPADGPWATTEYFDFQDLSEEPIELAADLGYPIGYVNTQYLWSMFPPADAEGGGGSEGGGGGSGSSGGTGGGTGGGTSAVVGGSTGHLCNIVPAASGDIVLTLSMAWFVEDTADFTTMESRAAFTVR